MTGHGSRAAWLGLLAAGVAVIGCSSRRVALDDGGSPDSRRLDAIAPRRDTSLPDQRADLKPAPGPWLKRFGGTGFDEGWDLAVDHAGNVYLLGRIAGSVDLGGGPLAAAEGEGSAFIVSYAADGTHRWSKLLGALGAIDPFLAGDGAGNVYLGGSLQHSPIDFGGGPILPDQLFVASLSSSGAHRWSRGLPSTGASSVKRLVADELGHVVIAGYFEGTVDLGGGPLTGDADFFIASLSVVDGSHHWSAGYGSKGSESGEWVSSLAVDKAGNLYLGGAYSGPMDLGGGMLPHVWSYDPFIASFTAAGAYRWAKTAGSADSTGVPYLASDGSNVFAGGSMAGTVSFGGDTLKLEGHQLVGASFTGAGVHRWSKVLGGGLQGGQIPLAGVVVDGAGQPTVFGTFQQTAELGGTVLQSKGDVDIVLASFSGGGDLRWVKQLGGPGDDQVYAVAPGPGGALYVAGSFSQTAVLEVGSVTSLGSRDGFLLRMLPK